MIEFLLFMVGAALVGVLYQRQRALERQVDELRDRLMRIDPGVAPLPVMEAPRRPAVARRAAPPPSVSAEPPPAPQPPPALQPPPAPEPVAAPPAERPGFESLIGGKLPIWTGGAALVVAGFFLVRYSIESGLLGPAVRVVLAALFSLLLIAASEIARRWSAVRDDPRVGQALAGAGVASAYGTLYIAAAQYHLVGPAAGFALMLAITLAALGLALRQGPPTAIMALIGGFAAPLVAGFDAIGVGMLLAYLAVFTAALFALAIRQRWGWLVIASVVAGFGWANLLVLAVDGDGVSGVAAFVTALAIGGTLALPRAGEARRWLRAAPMVLGLIQLLVLAPSLSFDAFAWSFHLILSAAALVLAWRDRTLLPAALAAPALVLVLLAGGFLSPPVTGATITAAIAATLMFGGAGLALSRQARSWAWIALLGIAGPVIVAHATAPELLARPGWTLLELLAAAAAAALAWRHRDRAGDTGLVEGATAGAGLAALALGSLVGLAWAPVPVALAMAALALVAHRLKDGAMAERPVLFAAALVILAADPLAALARMLAASLMGDSLTYPLTPSLADTLRAIGVPALALLALLRLPEAFGRARQVTAALGGLAALLSAYVVAKQPLAVATPEGFVAWGFTERAAITLLILAAGWLLARRAPRPLGHALLLLAVARIAYFDLLILNPAVEAQAVGAIPLLNMAVLLPALAAAGLLTLGGGTWWRNLGLAGTAIATATIVRQIAHGAVLTGGVGTGENWGYSAAFLALAIAWLAAGIRSGGRTLRIAGLALLTLVTLKVFLIDVAALGGLLRILSFLGLGVALIGIGWAYGRVLSPRATAAASSPPLG